MTNAMNLPEMKEEDWRKREEDVYEKWVKEENGRRDYRTLSKRREYNNFRTLLRYGSCHWQSIKILN